MHFFKLAIVTLPTLALVNATRLSGPSVELPGLGANADLYTHCQVEPRAGASSTLMMYCNVQNTLENSKSGLTILNCTGMDIDNGQSLNSFHSHKLIALQTLEIALRYLPIVS